jgi:hypothetical protein
MRALKRPIHGSTLEAQQSDLANRKKHRSSGSDRGNERSLRDHRHCSRADGPVAVFGDESVESDLYMTDRRGDAKNVEFGSLHRYSVPAYRRTGHGQLVGAASATKIDRQEGSDREVVLKGPTRDRGEAGSLLRSKKSKAGSERIEQLIKPVTSHMELSRNEDFVSLHSDPETGADPATHLLTTMDIDIKAVDSGLETTVHDAIGDTERVPPDDVDVEKPPDEDDTEQSLAADEAVEQVPDDGDVEILSRPGHDAEEASGSLNTRHGKT